jgi:hypothetical protein
MMAQRYRLIALTNPVEGREAEFDTWYDRHIRDILRIPGFVAAQRHRVTSRQRAKPPAWRHLAIYEVETDDLDSVMREMDWRVGTDDVPLSPALDGKRLAFFVEPISPLLTAERR